MRFIVALSATALIAGLTIVACNNDSPTLPDVNPVAAEPPVQQTVTPSVVPVPGGIGSSWTENGVKVTILTDEWGVGSCHTSDGKRTLLIENNRDHEIYSNRAAFTDPSLTCATDHTPTGKPNMTGPDHIAAGQSGEVTYSVTIPECGSLQVDDCWGPGGFQGCSFVVGDGFKSTKTCDGCVEAPVKKCGDWNECHEHPEAGCWEERECTTDYQCKDDVVTEEKQKCDCDCVEGGPYGPTDVDGPFWDPTIFEGKCPLFTKSCTEECYQLGKQPWIITYDCKDPERGETDLCRPVDCPKPEGLSHVSNKGSDRNMMMVITRNGHQHHLGRCPPDIPKSHGCAEVIAAAEACNPGATNYDCKDVR